MSRREILVWLPDTGSLNQDASLKVMSHKSGDYTFLKDMTSYTGEQYENGALYGIVNALENYEIPDFSIRPTIFYIKVKKSDLSPFYLTGAKISVFDRNTEWVAEGNFYDLATFSGLSFIDIILSNAHPDYEFICGFSINENVIDPIIFIDDPTGLVEYGILEEGINIQTHARFAGYINHGENFFAFYTGAANDIFEFKMNVLNVQNRLIQTFKPANTYPDIPEGEHYVEITSEKINGNPLSQYYDGVYKYSYLPYTNTFELSDNVSANGYVFNTDTPDGILKAKVGHIGPCRIYYFKKTRRRNNNLVAYVPTLIYEGQCLSLNPYHKVYGVALDEKDEIHLIFHRWKHGPATHIVVKKPIVKNGLLAYNNITTLDGEPHGFYSGGVCSINMYSPPNRYANNKPKILETKLNLGEGKIRVGVKKYYIKYKYKGDTIYRYYISDNEHFLPASQDNNVKTFHGGTVNDTATANGTVKIKCLPGSLSELHVGCIEKTGPLSFNTFIFESHFDNIKHIVYARHNDIGKEMPDPEFQAFLSSSQYYYNIEAVEFINDRILYGNFEIGFLMPPMIDYRTEMHSIAYHDISLPKSPYSMTRGFDDWVGQPGISQYHNRGYCPNEIYQFFVVGINHDGIVSRPGWLTDIIVQAVDYNNPSEQPGGDLGDRLGTVAYYTIADSHDDNTYQQLKIDITNIYKTFARHRYKDLIFLQNERVGRVKHNAIAFATQWDIDMTFAKRDLSFFAPSDMNLDTFTLFGEYIDMYLTFNRAGFASNFIQNVSHWKDEHLLNALTSVNHITTHSMPYGACGGYVYYGPNRHLPPFSNIFDSFSGGAMDYSQYTTYYATKQYVKPRPSRWVMSKNIFMLFSPEDLLLGNTEINGYNLKFLIYANPTGATTMQSNFYSEFRADFFRQPPSSLMGASSYTPYAGELSVEALSPHLTNILFYGQINHDDVKELDVFDIKYCKRGEQAIFNVNEANFLLNTNYFVYLINYTQSPLTRTFNAFTLNPSDPSPARKLQIQRAIIDKKNASYLIGIFTNSPPSAATSILPPPYTLTFDNMWASSSQYTAKHWASLSSWSYLIHVTDDMRDYCKNGHRFYYETESGFVISTENFFDDKNDVAQAFDKTGFAFFTQIIDKEIYVKEGHADNKTIRNAICVQTIENFCFNTSDFTHRFLCEKGDTFLNLISHKIAYPRKESFAYPNEYDNDHTVTGVAIQYVIPSFVNFAARNVHFREPQEGITKSNTDLPAWPQNQHSPAEYCKNFNNDHYAIDPAYTNTTMPPMSFDIVYDHKKRQKEEYPNIIVYSNPIKENIRAEATKFLIQNAITMFRDKGPITHIISLNGAALVMARNSASKFLYVGSNTFITDDDSEQVLIRRNTDVWPARSEAMAYGLQHKDAIVKFNTPGGDIIVFYDALQKSIVQFGVEGIRLKSLKNNSFFKRILTPHVLKNQRNFGIFAIRDVSRNEAIFIFRPKDVYAKPWHPGLPGITSLTDTFENEDWLLTNTAFLTTYHGDVTQNPIFPVIPVGQIYDDIANGTVKTYFFDENSFPFYQSHPNHTLGSHIGHRSYIIPNFAVSTNIYKDGLQSFYSFLPFEIINAQTDAIIHRPQKTTTPQNKPLMLIMNAGNITNRGNIYGVISDPVLTINFNTGINPAILRNIYVDSINPPKAVTVKSQAGTSVATNFTTINRQFNFQIPPVNQTTSHISTFFEVKLEFDSSDEVGLASVSAIVDYEISGPAAHVAITL